MKTKCFLATLFMLFSYSAMVSGGTVSGSLSGDSLIAPSPVESISVGLNYDEGKRLIKFSQGNAEQLDSRAYSFFIGYDLSEWCTVFATLGNSAARLSERQKLGDAKAKWSIGINANLWQVKIEEPEIFTGRICLKPVLELSQFNSNIDNHSIKWTDISGALFLSYDKIIENPKYNLTEFYGYSIYAGPAFSLIDGSRDNSDFQEDRSVGIIAGFDFLITHSLSVGSQLQSFDQRSFGINVRYHF